MSRDLAAPRVTAASDGNSVTSNIAQRLSVHEHVVYVSCMHDEFTIMLVLRMYSICLQMHMGVRMGGGAGGGVTCHPGI